MASAMITIDLPLRTYNPLNGSWGNHFKHARAMKRQRGTACLLTKIRINGMQPPVNVTLTRLSANAGSASELDDDGLRSSLKAIRDGIADAFNMHLSQEKRDGKNSGLHFVYLQERCKRGAFGVRVCIEGEG